MKSNFTLYSFLIFCFTQLPALAQIQYPLDSALVNPLAHPRDIASNREIALVFDERDPNNNAIHVHHKYFDVNQLNINDMNTNIALQTNFPVYDGAPDNHGNRHIGSCSGDFDGDGVDDLQLQQKVLHTKFICELMARN